MSMLARRILRLVDGLERTQVAASAAAQRRQSRLVMNAVFYDPQAAAACERFAEAQIRYGAHSPEAQQAWERESHMLLKYTSPEAIARIEEAAGKNEFARGTGRR